jgi:hypothetical protein
LIEFCWLKKSDRRRCASRTAFGDRKVKKSSS